MLRDSMLEMMAVVSSGSQLPASCRRGLRGGEVPPRMGDWGIRRDWSFCSTELMAPLTGESLNDTMVWLCCKMCGEVWSRIVYHDVASLSSKVLAT